MGDVEEGEKAFIQDDDRIDKENEEVDEEDERDVDHNDEEDVDLGDGEHEKDDVQDVEESVEDEKVNEVVVGEGIVEVENED